MKKQISALLAAAVLSAVSASEVSCRDYSAIARNMGFFGVSAYPGEVCEVEIPESFTPVYERYNALQKEGGYDLSNYRGKKCVRYTYTIEDKNARLNVLVYNGNVIGGDICSVTLDGIMIPIKKEAAENAP